MLEKHQVASLKQQAARKSDAAEEGVGPDPPTTAAVNLNKFDDAEWEARLNEQKEVHDTLVEVGCCVVEFVNVEQGRCRALRMVSEMSES